MEWNLELEGALRSEMGLGEAGLDLELRRGGSLKENNDVLARKRVMDEWQSGTIASTRASSLVIVTLLDQCM